MLSTARHRQSKHLRPRQCAKRQFLAGVQETDEEGLDGGNVNPSSSLPSGWKRLWRREAVARKLWRCPRLHQHLTSMRAPSFKEPGLCLCQRPDRLLPLLPGGFQMRQRETRILRQCLPIGSPDQAQIPASLLLAADNLSRLTRSPYLVKHCCELEKRTLNLRARVREWIVFKVCFHLWALLDACSYPAQRHCV